MGWEVGRRRGDVVGEGEREKEVGWEVGRRRGRKVEVEGWRKS